MKNEFVVNVYSQTVRNFLFPNTIEHTHRKITYLFKHTIKIKVLNYAMLESDKNFRSRIFTDELKFNLFDYNGQRFVWRREGIELKSANIKATLRHSGEKL